MDLSVDHSKYFWFHHTAADTVDKVNPRELSQCAAALAVMALFVADAPERLRVEPTAVQIWFSVHAA